MCAYIYMYVNMYIHFDDAPTVTGDVASLPTSDVMGARIYAAMIYIYIYIYIYT